MFAAKQSQGAAYGSRVFLEEVFQQRREKSGRRRNDGARPIREVHWEELMSLRTLRKAEL